MKLQQFDKVRQFIRAVLLEAPLGAKKTKSEKVKNVALKQKAVLTDTGPLAAIAAEIQATLDNSPTLVNFMETPTGLEHAREKFKRFKVDGSDKIVPASYGAAIAGGPKKEIMASNYAWFCKFKIEQWKVATGMEFDTSDVASILIAYAETVGPKVAAAEAKLVARVLPLNVDGIDKLMSNIDADADEPKGGPLGKIAWGEIRADVKSKEPNTELEDRLITSLRDRLMYGSNPMDEDTSNEWIKLLASSKYSKRIVPWKKGNIYRGLSLNEAELKALLNISGSIPNEGSKKGKFIIKSYYDSKGIIGGAASSWSPVKKVTDGFRGPGGLYTKGKAGYSVTLTASSVDNQNKLLDLVASGIYKLKLFGSNFTWSREREVVGFGNMMCNEVEWERVK